MEKKYSLGEPTPNKTHAIISNIPTFEDVCAYKEKLPYVSKLLKQGYPRFVRHYLIEKLNNNIMKNIGFENYWSVIVYQSDFIKNTILALDKSIKYKEIVCGKFRSNIFYVKRSNTDAVNILKSFVQHSGCEISSRISEKILKKEVINYDDRNIIKLKRHISKYFEDFKDINNIFITPSGMSSFFFAFKASQEIQKKNRRLKWLQIGWLYVDTGKILEKYLTDEEDLEIIYDISDTDRIVKKINSYSHMLSTVVVECPTNPHCEIIDLQRIYCAVKNAGGILILDPSVVSIYNFECYNCFDLLVTSLTKYTAYTGEVMSGAIIANESSRYLNELIQFIKKNHISIDAVNAKKLSNIINRSEEYVNKMNNNCKNLVKYLNNHPRVKNIYWSGKNIKRLNYLKSNQSLGSILSIELYGKMETFYDRLQLVKGPSFGTNFTIVCPYFYLAHYDLVKCNQEESLFKKLKINPDLIRISVGCEPYDELERTFKKALS